MRQAYLKLCSYVFEIPNNGIKITDQLVSKHSAKHILSFFKYNSNKKKKKTNLKFSSFC